MGCEQLATKADIQAIDTKLTALEQKIDNLTSIFTDFSQAIAEIKQLINNGFELVKELLDFVKEILPQILDFLENVIKAQLDNLANLINNVFDTIQTAINGLVSIIQSIFGGGNNQEQIQQIVTAAKNEIINYIDNKLNTIEQKIVDLINSIAALSNAVQTAKSEIISHIDNKISWLHQQILDLFNIVGTSLTALYNNIADLINALNFEPINYEQIQGMITNIKIEILNKIDDIKNEIFERINQAESAILAAIAALGLLGLLNTIGNQIGQLLLLLNNILNLLNNLKDLFDGNSNELSDEIEQTKIELNSIIIAQHNQTRNTTLNLQSNFNEQSNQFNSKIQTVIDSVQTVNVTVQTIDNNIENFEADPIDYDRINGHTTERINWLHQQILDLHNLLSNSLTSLYNNITGFITSKLGNSAKTHTGSCVDGSYIDVEVESITVFDSITALSDQVKAFHTGSCNNTTDNELVVGLIAAEKELLAITGNQLVLHFVTEDNYPKRTAGSNYRPVQVYPPKLEYDWATHFEDLRWESGNQYAALKLVGWKNAISGWFASPEAANSYFNYLIENILDENVEVDDIVIPDHSNPKTNVAVQMWRPYRAFLMSEPSNNNTTTCLQKYYPSTTPENQ